LSKIFLSKIKDVDGRDITAFTPVFDGLGPAMTALRSAASADMIEPGIANHP
jgi:hypothetical protein